MTNEHKSTRLGDLLVERGVITRHQLSLAIELQQTRRQQSAQFNSLDSKQELGELLIELGFLNRKELVSGLGWQRRLRKTTAVMVFIAPLLTAACGGGGGGSSSTSNVQAPTQNSHTMSSDPTVNKTVSSSISSAAFSADTSSSTSSNSIAPVSSSSISSSSSLSSMASSSVPSTTTVVNGSVQVYWSVPNRRENGNFLDISEIGGYELRYKRKSDTRYTSVLIEDNYTDSFYFDNLQGEYEFEIAAYDVNGLYSTFVQVKPI